MTEIRRNFAIVASALLAVAGMRSLAADPAATPAAATPAAASSATAGPAPAPAAYSPQGADSCLSCHSDATVTGIFRTKHARPDDPHGPFGHGGLQCEACHGPGGAHVAAGGGPLAGMVAFGSKSVTPVSVQNAKCLGCHQTNAAHDWASSAHAANNVACAACHTLHAAKDPVKTAATQIEVCTACHQAQRAAIFKPSHHPLREGKMACTSCHLPHGGSAPAQLVKNSITETCTSCHTEFRGPFLWEHQPVAENCANCHDPHGSAQPALLKIRTPFLCQTCHGGAGHPSIANTPQGLPGSAPSTYLLAGGCINCHSQVHGSNHPSGRALMR
ncbi:MAG: DmsE family decaheme c-type cytochrome [Gammaproteobacteria bacterium]